MVGDSLLELLTKIDDSLLDGRHWPAAMAELQRVLPVSSDGAVPALPSLQTVRSFRREARAGSPEQQQLFRFLCSHIEKSILLQQQLDSARMREDAAQQALDYASWGVLLVNEDAKVLMSNAAARELLNQKDGLLLHQECLMATRANDSLVLRQAVNAVAMHQSSSLALGLPRPSLRHVLALMITRAGSSLRSANDHAGKGLALVFVNDPDRKVEVDPPELSRLYGLTRAEALLACEILAGRSLNEAAQALSISANTARTHLKRIFLKTDTNRQTQLVVLLRNSVGA